MTEMRPMWKGGHTHHFPCSCADWHYISVMYEDDEINDGWDEHLDICDTWEPRRWRDRVKAAYKMLRGKPHYATGVVLDVENTLDLKEVIDNLVKRNEERGRASKISNV